MKRASLYLDEAQIAALDEACRDQGVSRAELTRCLIAGAIGGSRNNDLAADLAAIEESCGALRGEDDLPIREPAELIHRLGRVARRWPCARPPLVDRKSQIPYADISWWNRQRPAGARSDVWVTDEINPNERNVDQRKRRLSSPSPAARLRSCSTLRSSRSPPNGRKTDGEQPCTPNSPT